MDCPNCNKSFHPQPSYSDVSRHSQQHGRDYIIFLQCPSCKTTILFLKSNSEQSEITRFFQQPEPDPEKFGVLIYPNKKHKPLSNDIPQEYQKDFYEASDVIETSPKASAALSRYCLQRLLIEKAGVKKRDLADQIQEVLDSKQLPSHLASDIDTIRAVGNFGTHPIKSTNSGVIVDVQAGEAEWNLNVLERLLDFYFVSPAESQRRKNAINQKLQEAGKPLLK